MASGTGQFKDKVVWITGAGTGIGRETALMFAREGAQLALFGRRPETLHDVRDAAQAEGARVEVRPVDVAERAAVLPASEDLLQVYGRVDILVNNAGANTQKRRLRELSPDDWDHIIHVNLTGAYNMIASVLPPMRTQGGGLIVNISSMAAKSGSGLSGAAYTASKHGMNGLSHAINTEEWNHGIRATAICPGEVDTPFLSLRPIPVTEQDRVQLIAPVDIAEAVRFVAALPPRTTVSEMLVVPTHKRQHKPGETG